MAFVRVKAPDGAKFSIDEVAAKSMGVTVLSEPAVDINGRPLDFEPAPESPAAVVKPINKEN
jgi:hypothetical protein